MTKIECLVCDKIETLYDGQKQYICCSKCYNQFSAIFEEFQKATKKFGPFHNTHEGYAVLKEEVDELWDAVKANDTQHALKEAVQVGAMALRFIVDCSKNNNEK